MFCWSPSLAVDCLRTRKFISVGNTFLSFRVRRIIAATVNDTLCLEKDNIFLQLVIGSTSRSYAALCSYSLLACMFALALPCSWNRHAGKYVKHDLARLTWNLYWSCQEQNLPPQLNSLRVSCRRREKGGGPVAGLAASAQRFATESDLAGAGVMVTGQSAL